jgi:HD domain
VEAGWPDGLRPPDSSVAREARELCATVSPSFLVNHAARTFAWGCMLARADQVAFDRELLYVASLLHDLGLTEAFDGPRCFEHESASAAERFARQRGWDPERRFALAEAIRLHMQARVVPEDGAEAYLLAAATSCDVTGWRYQDLDPDQMAKVLQVAPREGFGPGFAGLFADQARRKPGCMADAYVKQGLLERIVRAPFEQP